MQEVAKQPAEMSKEAFVQEVLNDYRIAFESRQASLIGRKEVLTGKAKFGIFGDGKEIAQIAMAKVFQHGDWRSGYYRDQTFMFAKGISSIHAFFAQLYAIPDTEKEPASGGRSMNGHFATRLLDDNGNWLPQTDRFNSSADISPTAGQMPRLLGLAVASKLYRQNPDLHAFSDFSNKGNEIAFGTIGNASSSEGIFWEVMNAACVMQVPMLMSLWDDGYGISVPAKYQTAKENIAALMRGFQSNEEGQGLELLTARGWNYPELCKVYKQAADICREKHTPVLVHVTEVTQPQGHSTSGSHERYKSKERLEWETEFDGIAQMRQWMIEQNIADETTLTALEEKALEAVKQAQKQAWIDYLQPIKSEVSGLISLLQQLAASGLSPELANIAQSLSDAKDPIRRDMGVAIHKALRLTVNASADARKPLLDYLNAFNAINGERYSSHVYSQSESSVLNVPEVPAQYTEEVVDGYQVVRACFDANLERDPRVFAFGEDVGKIGDVNQGFSGMQEKYGELRVTDKGIREWSIIGEGIGAAMRGLRPIAEIQYLDYLLYALEPMSDDIATMQYRTKGGQKTPIIIRTRGHRLEGIWHSGSPMGMIIHAVRGMHVCVPRNMTQAAGMYNTLLRADEPALVVECLNGYRIKEKLPANIGEFTVPFGKPDVLRFGEDITLVTYGSCCRIAQEACDLLAEHGIRVELIDVQTLLPFDINHSIVESLKSTNRIVFLDEDVPGGATSYMMQQVLEEQGGYQYLDSKPVTITANEHRPAYGSDGDYFSKPSVDTVFSTLYQMMHESNPTKWPSLL
ncbi:MAG: alpha-ketoacid dehydrogenase subunit alpha/beta [Bacteroidia bacterium]|jgi:pyruvate/2-oxoglutarate/acetoin dehydrogenase E1 component/TPP-dependent pyruvate/acetoin dehydrogenase alpha subunit